MKQIFGLLVLVIAMVFFSCNKEEIVSVINTEAIKAQLDNAPMPSEEKTKILETSSSLKSGNTEKYSTKIIPCDQMGYEIDEYRNTASRYLNYFKRAESGYLLNSLTIKETFNIYDGTIDLNNSLLTLYKVGYGFKRVLSLEDPENICRVDYFFRPDEGAQYSFFSEWKWSIEIPSSLKGKWQVRITYCDGQVFSSGLIDYYNQPQILIVRLDLEREKVVSSISINRSWIEGATNLVLHGNDDEIINAPVLFDEDLPERIIFSAPFDIKYFNISGSQKYDYYYTENASLSFSISDGSKIYKF